MNFTERALNYAYTEAIRSPDPSSQIGAIMTYGSLVLGEGHNRFPAGVEVTEHRLTHRPTKYQHIVHAEVVATLDAFQAGAMMDKCVLHVTLPACTECAKVIIESGVRHVVGHANLRKFADDYDMWIEERARGIAMLTEAGVTVDWFEGRIDGAPSVLIAGKTFSPNLV